MLGYHAPTGILPTFLAKARAYGFTDLNEAFFDPATYGVPPPPLLHGLGENVTTHWAPSLRYRERGMPDPEDSSDRWHEFEERLKAEAKAKHHEANRVQVQVHAKPTSAPARPAVTAAPARPPPGSRDDRTPPPTRAPAGPRPAPHPPAPVRNGTSDQTNADELSLEQAKVEVDAGLMEEDEDSTNIKRNPLRDAQLAARGRPIPPKR